MLAALLLAVCPVATGPAPARPPAFAGAGEPDPVKVYVLAGQSNMKGLGTSTQDVGAPWNAPQRDVSIWRKSTGQWVELQEGFGESFGPELSFGRAVADRYPEEQAYLVKVAANGTSLHNDWYPGTGYQFVKFQTTMAQALDALELEGIEYELAGMLWMQGEADALEGQGAAYEANLRALIEAVRAISGDPELPFVLGRITTFFGDVANNTAVREAQVVVAGTTANVEVFDTDDLEPVLLGHYLSSAQIELGQRFATGLFATRVWEDLGSGLAGSAGVPRLDGSGALYGGDPVELRLDDALPETPAFLVWSTASAFTPLFGGTLVPDLFGPPGGVFAGATDELGAAAWSFGWPAAAASGTALTYQAWVLDGGAVQGVAASNGLRSTSP